MESGFLRQLLPFSKDNHLLLLYSLGPQGTGRKGKIKTALRVLMLILLRDLSNLRQEFFFLPDSLSLLSLLLHSLSSSLDTFHLQDSLRTQCKLTSSSESSCFSLPAAGIMPMFHHAWPISQMKVATYRAFRKCHVPSMEGLGCGGPD